MEKRHPTFSYDKAQRVRDELRLVWRQGPDCVRTGMHSSRSRVQGQRPDTGGLPTMTCTLAEQLLLPPCASARLSVTGVDVAWVKVGLFQLYLGRPR